MTAGLFSFQTFFCPAALLHFLCHLYTLSCTLLAPLSDLVCLLFVFVQVFLPAITQVVLPRWRNQFKTSNIVISNSVFQDLSEVREWEQNAVNFAAVPPIRKGWETLIKPETISQAIEKKPSRKLIRKYIDRNVTSWHQ